MPAADPETFLPLILWVVSLYGVLFFAGIPLLLRFIAAHGVRGLFPADGFRWLATRVWTPVDAAVVFLTLVLVSSATAVGYMELADRFGWPARNEQGLLILQSIAFHWFGFLLLMGWAAFRGYSLTGGFALRPGRTASTLVQGAGFLAATMVPVIAVHLVYVLGLLITGVPLVPQDVTRVIAEAGGWGTRLYFALLGVVVAPVVEELLFRGVLLPALSRVLHPVVAMVATSVLFAIIHANLLAFAALFTLSMGLCLAVTHTRNLGVAIVMHALFNAIPMTALLFGLPL